MSADRFADRLSVGTYADDPVVGIFESSPGEHDAVSLPERLFNRLTAVASAYELHSLPLLGGSDPVTLNRSQCESLLDEVEFVAERLNDPLAVETAQRVANYVVTRLRRPSWTGTLTFEGE